MKALLCTAHGDPETLTLTDVPEPQPGAGEVRIAMRAAGVNFPDSLIIRNLYQLKPPLPFAPGGELAGVIDALGEGVAGLAVGDRVAALTGCGAFAEQVVVPAARVLPIAAGMDFETAAGFTMAYGTSYHALAQRAAMQPGETLLVLGAAGGVGLAAVEIGKAMGARVIAAASSPEKLALARAHGADEAIDYAAEPLRDALRRLCGEKGVDVVYDPVGDRFAEPAFRAMAWNGRYLVIGFAGGDIPALPLNLPLLKGAAIVGVFWGAFTTREPDVNRANVAALERLFAEGRLRPHVSLRLPLAEGGAAIRRMMERRAEGKIVLVA